LEGEDASAKASKDYHRRRRHQNLIRRPISDLLLASLASTRKAVSRGLPIAYVLASANRYIESSSAGMIRGERIPFSPSERCCVIDSLVVLTPIYAEQKALSWMQSNIPNFEFEFVGEG